MGRKSKTTTEFGAKFGSSVRKKYTKVIRVLKSKRKCPDCGSIKFKRKYVGIWQCDKCKLKLADAAYDTTTI
ncbi:MAG: 50S ribosomal protein L37 [Thaumarchaeota archaeon]|jgi:large subunit ribosomal protein L37Ae|nr:50S ribosomal protein L37 [Nitrososphaerota archaeon]|tara:strand:+ start:5510 stop:5725 length:216 start_codon:yes stop_codon:yes gene_type:complete